MNRNCFESGVNRRVKCESRGVARSVAAMVLFVKIGSMDRSEICIETTCLLTLFLFSTLLKNPCTLNLKFGTMPKQTMVYFLVARRNGKLRNGWKCWTNMLWFCGFLRLLWQNWNFKLILHSIALENTWNCQFLLIFCLQFGFTWVIDYLYSQFDIINTTVQKFDMWL